MHVASTRKQNIVEYLSFDKQKFGSEHAFDCNKMSEKVILCVTVFLIQQCMAAKAQPMKLTKLMQILLFLKPCQDSQSIHIRENRIIHQKRKRLTAYGTLQ